MAVVWFCEIEKEELGPLSAQQLRALVEQGRLTAEHRVRQGTDGSWVPASRVKGLFATADPPPLPKRHEIPEAGPIGANDDPPTAKAKPAPRRAVKPVDSTPKRTLPAAGARVPRAEASAAPPAPPKKAAADPPRGNRFQIVAEAHTPRARAAGRTGAGGAGRKRKNSALVAGLLAVLVVVLAVAGIVLAVVGNPWANSPGAAANEEQGPDVLEGSPAQGSPEPPSENREAGAAMAAAHQWIDASQASIDSHGVKIRVSSTRIGRPRVLQASGRAARPTRLYLLITVQLQNAGAGQALNYTSWGGNASISRQVKLADNLGKAYRPRNFAPATIDGQLASAPVDANQRIRDLLVFELPAENAEFLMLQLPAAAFGKPGALYFKIPKTMILEAAEEPPPVAEPTAVDAPRDADHEPPRPIHPLGERQEPFEEEEDPDGDVSAITRGIEELGGGDRQQDHGRFSPADESDPFRALPERKTP